MPNSQRVHSNICHLQSTVEIRETADGFELALDIRGTEGVPLAIEITLRPGGELRGDGLVAVPGASDANFLHDGYAEYELAGRRLRVGPGFRK